MKLLSKMSAACVLCQHCVENDCTQATCNFSLYIPFLRQKDKVIPKNNLVITITLDEVEKYIPIIYERFANLEKALSNVIPKTVIISPEKQSNFNNFLTPKPNKKD